MSGVFSDPYFPRKENTGERKPLLLTFALSSEKLTTIYEEVYLHLRLSEHYFTDSVARWKK